MADEITVYRFRGDNSDLKATLRENQQALKVAAKEASATKVRIVAQLDVSRVGQQARAAVRMLESSLPPIRVRMVLVPPNGGGGGRGPMMLPAPGMGGGGMGGGGGGGNVSGGYVPNWRGPGGTSVSSGTGAGWQAGGTGSAGAWQSIVPLAFRTGTQQNAAFRASQGGAGRSTLGNFGTIFALGAVTGTLRAAGGIRDSFRDYNARDPVRHMQGVTGMLRAGGQIPILGAGVEFASEWSGYGRMAESAQRDAESTQQARAQQQARFDDIKIERAQLRGDDAEVIRLEGAQRAMALRGDHANPAGVKAEQDLVSRRLADLQDRNRAFSRGEAARGEAAGQTSAGIAAYNAGDTNYAALFESNAGRVGLIEAGRSRLDGVKDPEKRRAISQANDAELKAYNDRSNMELAEREKARAADVASVVSAKQEASLRIAKQNYAADLAAFDAMSKAKVEAIQDVEGKRNEADRDAAQRAVMVAQHQQQVAESVSESVAGTQAANLRAGQRGFEAGMVEFEAAAKRRLDHIEDPQEKAAAKSEVDAQRREMVADRNRQLADVRGNLSARSQAAVASGNFNDRLASTITNLAAMESEVRNADADVRGQVAGTQKTELVAMRDRLLRGNEDQRAVAFDPRRMVGSSAADRSTQETNAILKMILDAIKQADTIVKAG